VSRTSLLVRPCLGRPARGSGPVVVVRGLPRAAQLLEGRGPLARLEPQSSCRSRRKRMRIIRCGALLLTVALTACTSTRPAGERSTPTATLGSPAASPSPKASGVFVRACDDSVFGELGRGWKKASVIMGPIAFVGLPSYRDGPDRFFRSRHGRYPALKVLAVVSGEGVISVSIVPGDTDRVRMMYDPAAWGERNLYPLDAGDTTTVFGPCLTHRSTQFNGGFLITGRTCATLEVSVGGEQPLRKLVSFGALSCRD
jgi:hypothetical protein